MSRGLRRRLRNLELASSGRLSKEELRRLEETRMEDLIEKVKGVYPDEAELWTAYERSCSLEPSDKMEDVEEYVETGKFILRQIKRLQAEQAQPSK